jgi:hypothetical protein
MSRALWPPRHLHSWAASFRSAAARAPSSIHSSSIPRLVTGGRFSEKAGDAARRSFHKASSAQQEDQEELHGIRREGQAGKGRISRERSVESPHESSSC